MHGPDRSLRKRNCCVPWLNIRVGDRIGFNEGAGSSREGVVSVPQHIWIQFVHHLSSGDRATKLPLLLNVHRKPLLLPRSKPLTVNRDVGYAVNNHALNTRRNCVYHAGYLSE
jgi:hypothetical protein